MKNLIHIVYILGVLFWISFLLYGLARMFAFNGFGDHYSFSCKSAKQFELIKEQNDNLKIVYSYDVLGESYTVDERISGELFREKVGSVQALTICYNNSYPSLSYIQGVNLSVSREKTGIVVSIIFLMLITILYLYAKGDYWIKKYKSLFKKLSATNEST